jgi:hypothetical protein
MCIDDSCFFPPTLLDLVHSSNQSVAESVSSAASATPNGTGGDESKQAPPPISRTFSSTSMLSALEMNSPSNSMKGESAPLFHLEIVFMSTCNYVRMPKGVLKNALKLEDYATTTGDTTF